jgi:hypothetical protein
MISSWRIDWLKSGSWLDSERVSIASIARFFPKTPPSSRTINVGQAKLHQLSGLWESVQVLMVPSSRAVQSARAGARWRMQDLNKHAAPHLKFGPPSVFRIHRSTSIGFLQSLLRINSKVHAFLFECRDSIIISRV